MNDAATPILHAGLIARRSRRGRWAGALLQGPSGAGKSDLALRAMERGWRLVADDRVIVWISAGRLFGRAPAMLGGRVEARGLGVLRTAYLPFCEIVLAVACAPPGVGLDRCPEPERRSLAGRDLPLLRLAARQASALAKLESALAAVAFDSGPAERIERGFRPGGEGAQAVSRPPLKGRA